MKYIVVDGTYIIPGGSAYTTTAHVRPDGTAFLGSPSHHYLDSISTYPGAAHDSFKNAWLHDMNRTYRNPPVSGYYPYTDHGRGYFRSRAGDVYYISGTMQDHRPQYFDTRERSYGYRTSGAWYDPSRHAYPGTRGYYASSYSYPSAAYRWPTYTGRADYDYLSYF
ncbi:hypothetical protein CERSUDRAFT_114892 [Gelatoporia subvermispora B]|uniref:Uncharacterized protein n=1 Tax=Ceriporiopsis subvermispora (strain B) TaxID=914234 RepID=M2REX3_CERS8|nr:hypothetical protein CERSUDRAFT_114892 [Gelatoporia subvermispora B]